MPFAFRLSPVATLKNFAGSDFRPGRRFVHTSVCASNATSNLPFDRVGMFGLVRAVPERREQEGAKAKMFGKKSGRSVQDDSQSISSMLSKLADECLLVTSGKESQDQLNARIAECRTELSSMTKISKSEIESTVEFVLSFWSAKAGDDSFHLEAPPIATGETVELFQSTVRDLFQGLPVS